MLNYHQPDSIFPRPLLLMREGAPGADPALPAPRSTVFFTHYNDDGYQYTVPVGREYWHTWSMPFRVDPSRYR